MTGSRRRFLRIILLLAFAVIFIVLAIWMSNSDLAHNDQYASVISSFVGIAALAVAVADYLKPRNERAPEPRALADDLAATIQSQWLTEARARKLRDPGILPLTWSATERPVGEAVAAPESVAGQPASGRVLRLRLSGRLEGAFDEVTRRLARAYGQLSSGRLVILGEPGAGKSVLAILLTLGLLDGRIRTSDERVPVLLAMSSWDPVSESMDDWIMHTIAVSYYSGRVEIPRLLFERGLLLPILDGLDEIPESDRRVAVRAIKGAIGRDRPVVVTCRSAEYEDVIEGGAPVLRRAPVVEVEPVQVEDAITYLNEVDWPDGTTWERVYAHLREEARRPHSADEPVSPLASALSTPLMVSLARKVYQRCGGDPAELLNLEVFGSRHAVEDFLLDRVVDAAYAPDRLASGNPISGSSGKWDAAKARDWLTYLARYLHRHRERDLAWWLLSRRLLSPWVAPVIGLGAGMILMIVVSTGLLALNHTRDDSGQFAFSAGAGFGGGFAILSMIAWYVGIDRAPGRLSVAVQGSLRRLRRGFVTGLALTAIPVIPVLAGVAIEISIGSGWIPGNTRDYFSAMVITAALTTMVALAVAVHNWFDAPPVRSVQASPRGLIQQDRRSSLAGALAAGAVLGLTAGPALILGLVVTTVMQTLATGWRGEPSLGEVVSASAASVIEGDEVPMIIGAGMVLPFLVFALLILLTRAWPRFVVARFVLAVRGELPWRLLRFLADTREQELLRESGGTYQFRHIRLQERLASQRPGLSDLAKPAIRTTRWKRRSLVAISTAGILLCAVLLLNRLPRDSSNATILTYSGSPIALSPNGHVLAATPSDGGDIELWNLITHRPIGELPSSSILGFQDPKFSRDGRFVAATDSDSQTVRVWEVAKRKLFAVSHIPDSIESIEFSPDGRNIAIGGFFSRVPDLRLWTATTPYPVRIRASIRDPSSIGFSPDGRILSVGAEPGKLLDINGKPLPGPLGSSYAYVDFSHNGKIATLDEDGVVRFWNAKTRRQLGRPLTGLAGKVDSIMFSPDSQTLAGVDRGENMVRFWNVQNHQSLEPLHTGLESITFSPDGKKLATQDSGVVKVWDAHTHQSLGKPLTDKTDPVSSVEFSGDSRVLAVVGGDRVRLWYMDRLPTSDH